jgi:hypothetical protein
MGVINLLLVEKQALNALRLASLIETDGFRWSGMEPQGSSTSSSVFNGASRPILNHPL